MTSFSQAVNSRITATTNGMPAYVTTQTACLDLFYKIGASRGKDIIPQFIAAFVENPEIAIRIALWARDIRGGAGERQLFRDILLHMEKIDAAELPGVIQKIPELGRWDDLFIFTTDKYKELAYTEWKRGLFTGDALAAKWAPRKGPVAAALRKFLGLTPKDYRKLIVSLTNVVETPMCANQWDEINFSHVPSVAASRYRNAFNRHTKNFEKYVASLSNGEAKVNTGAVYPYDVIKNISGNSVENEFVVQQWNALENFIGDTKILPMVDVSGSMNCPAGGWQSRSSLSCMDVAVSLGLYISEKNTGTFKDMFMTFTDKPSFVTVKGTIVERLQQMKGSEWGMNTNIIAAFEELLRVAVSGGVSQEEMPELLLILSDMQFDHATDDHDHGPMIMDFIREKYNSGGYELPVIVFWNINSHDNVPVQSNEENVILISGFSPSIMKSVLGTKLENLTPENMMLEVVMNPRYNFK